jgi:hypothetical protein
LDGAIRVAAKRAHLSQVRTRQLTDFLRSIAVDHPHRETIIPIKVVVSPVKAIELDAAGVLSCLPASHDDRSNTLEPNMKPIRSISFWSPILMNGKGVILAGIERWGEERTSTTIAELDINARTAVTISGRHYELVGDHAPDAAVRAAIRTYLVNGIDPLKHTFQALTLEQAAEWLRAQAELPVISEENRAVAAEYRQHEIWAGLSLQRRESRLSTSEFAEACGLPEGIVAILPSGPTSLDGVDLDDAERALAEMRDRNPSVWRL